MLERTHAEGRVEAIRAELGSMVYSAQVIGRVLLEARENNDHLALGYSEWTSYLIGEYDQSVRTLYRYMAEAEIDRELAPPAVAEAPKLVGAPVEPTPEAITAPLHPTPSPVASNSGAPKPTPKSTPAPAKPKVELPNWYRRLETLDGFVHRDNPTRTIKSIEAKVERGGVTIKEVIDAFVMYYPTGRIQHGWQDPLASLRSSLLTQISKVRGANGRADTDPCPTCKGSGRIPKAKVTANDRDAYIEGARASGQGVDRD